MSEIPHNPMSTTERLESARREYYMALHQADPAAAVNGAIRRWQELVRVHTSFHMAGSGSAKATLCNGPDDGLPRHIDDKSEPCRLATMIVESDRAILGVLDALTHDGFDVKLAALSSGGQEWKP